MGGSDRPGAGPPHEVDTEPPSLRATESIPPPPPSSIVRWASGWRGRLSFGAIALVAAAAFAAPMIATYVAENRVQATPLTKGFASVPTAPPKPVEVVERADKDLDRGGRAYAAGGALVVLPKFASADGKFDLVLHFHGASDLVAQSFGAVDLNAVVVVFNLGIGSGAYEERFGYAPMIGAVYDQTVAEMKKRHLANPSIRRVALCAFSAGFGAVARVLEQPDEMDRVDAVLLLDGIHASYDEHHKIDLRRIASIVDFAKLAAKGEKLFFVTHSNIGTVDYASTHETADAVLDTLGITRQPGGDTPAMPELSSLGTEKSRKTLARLEPVSHAEKAGFYLRGYAGDKAANHLSHLHQLATTAAPKLAERWRTVPPP